MHTYEPRRTGPARAVRDPAARGLALRTLDLLKCCSIIVIVIVKAINSNSNRNRNSNSNRNSNLIILIIIIQMKIITIIVRRASRPLWERWKGGVLHVGVPKNCPEHARNKLEHCNTKRI